MSKSSEALLSKLKTSLPRPPKPERRAPATATAVSNPVELDIVDQIAVSQLTRLTVSIYQPDIDRLDAIKEFMKAKGFRNLKDSETLRLACRALEIGDHLVSVYQAMQREDRRRRPEIAKAG